MSKDQDHSARAGVVALARGAQRTMTTTVSRQLFSGRIKTALADKLIDAGIDAPERLLFMSEQEIGAIRGVGKAGLAEIQKYRERFVPTG